MEKKLQYWAISYLAGLPGLIYGSFKVGVQR